MEKLTKKVTAIAFVAAISMIVCVVSAGPIGGKIAFCSDRSGNNDIWVMDADGSNPTQVTVDTASDSSPSVSPDGAKICFSSTREASHYNLWKIDIDGKNLVRLTSGNQGDTDPDWSPDGTKIVFASYRPWGRGGAIWLMDPDGSDQTEIAYTSGYDTCHPSWSPDGSKIVYWRGIRYGGGDRGIWVMDADGSNPQRLTASDTVYEGCPVFSPDGSKIAYHSDASGNWDIWVMDADGSNQIQLTTDTSNDNCPTWSPDGTKIAFASDRSGNWDIWIMNADGSNQIQITTDASNERDPDWFAPMPSISIYTDKTSYTTGEKMHLGLDVKNPLDSAQRVSLNIYLETPTGGTLTLIDTTVTLPAGLIYSNPNFWGKKLPSIPEGKYTWHAILDDPVTGEIICEDTAEWEFVLTGAPTGDITEVLEQTTVVIEFAE